MKRFWPRSLFGRLLAISLVALMVAHMLNYGVALLIEQRSARVSESYFVAKDAAALSAVLEATPVAEHQKWLKTFERARRRFRLDGVAGPPLESPFATRVLAEARRDIGPAVSVTSGSAPDVLLTLNVPLKDGSTLRTDVLATAVSDPWQGVFVAVQMLTMAFFTWLAVRQATRPLTELAHAADRLGATLESEPLPLDGPAEVSRAAAAFNAMGKRIREHMTERTQILAAIAHDLQTPITRLRLRTDLMDDEEQRARWLRDLEAMQVLVAQGLEYARSTHSVEEAPAWLDLDALLEAIAGDYQDGGHQIALTGKAGRQIRTRPHALRRILCNLLDNALRYASEVELAVLTQDGKLALEVRDRGPGIPPEQLEQVLKPFVRLEASRNRDTGGAGLGLAIASQLATAIHARLTLANRDGGGLTARLEFKA